MQIQTLARILAKQARCWKGYEPVPGKAPYSEDSCRPAGSGKKKKEKKASYRMPQAETPAKCNRGNAESAVVKLARALAKQAWEVGDDTGWYSNWPLRYAVVLTSPPKVPYDHPDYDREFTTKTLHRALKKLPKGQQLHWVDPDAVLGTRAWYNPMRYLSGKQILGEQSYALDSTSDDKARNEIIQKILESGEGANALMSHYPASYFVDEPVSEMEAPQSTLNKTSAETCSCGCGKPAGECDCARAGSSPIQKLARLAAKQAEGAWTREEGQSASGGLNAKGRASLKAQGHDIKPPVTESKPKGERAGRKASFCARMGGMKKKLTSSDTANDPDSRINKALRKWNC